jgi:hypothetical protein
MMEPLESFYNPTRRGSILVHIITTCTCCLLLPKDPDHLLVVPCVMASIRYHKRRRAIQLQGIALRGGGGE